MSFSLPYKWVTADELAAMIKSKPTREISDFVVVDVRDDDYRGGNIISALNYPSEKFHDSVTGLVQRLESAPKVIFHCALSQARGPKAARIYAETRRNLIPNSATPQDVYVLRNGFSGFQAKFRDDPELIEKFNKYYHD